MQSSRIRAVEPIIRMLLLSAAGAAAPALGGEPCCGITAVDMRSGTVTARELDGRRMLQFKVDDPAVLRGLKVGQQVHADAALRRVSLDGVQPCCAIINVRPADPVNGSR